ncbi:glucose-6-phosphate isomerase, putative [Perkinsus marinus ATCC 50983]|uniref:Glucose-6-phosphate isomerase n=1 Tax=Perkinsus marinus (strain ATCC 50983 / TXsc) TaxID=423536 RepID=C5K7D7_PERM5|nr:glucose-6-phosphate isomerase, putative [Perkinsus marinus ATCC 50983]EER19472.1 glucose-6-phosphate isomerase, putative [Perkinsus marinus ATCC 50983]|eukprot:XP_002787676.1 glucose-6-phosphate isomerase, putative [Perkinsus marinus ATCC 50983]
MISSTQAFANAAAAADKIKNVHLKELMADEERNKSMFVTPSDLKGVTLDYSRERLNDASRKALFDLAEEAHLDQKIEDMFNGVKINTTEKRAVLHTALRAPRGSKVMVDGKNVIEDVWRVLDQIKNYSDKIRSGEHRGVTGKLLKNVVAVGIGGSYLGPEFVFEALRTDPVAKKAAEGRTTKFLANVDPIDVERALDGLNAEETLLVVISKTFTTAETMLNAKTVRQWLFDNLGKSPEVVSKHVCACSTALELTKEFGIDDENVFAFWDWVGGRYSVSSAVGCLPLALQYGFEQVNQFLQGAHLMDEHFRNTKDLSQNIPALMGLIAVWNRTFLGASSTAILPYCQALVRFVAHIQQLDMESNGKRVTLNGHTVDFSTGMVHFGEPGTNGQHSFYQELHQGTTIVPSEFIGFAKSQNPIKLAGEPVSNHDELMSNFFAQPDALAFGKGYDQLEKEGVPAELMDHKFFPGNRPSLSLLFPGTCNATSAGALLAAYEHRTMVQAAIWGTNCFDQWGVELGKVLAKSVRAHFANPSAGVSEFCGSTQRLLKQYHQMK